MPIISAEVIDSKKYRMTLTLGHGMMENVVITDDGLYSLYYIKDGKSINRNGRILNVVQNRAMPQNSYILFDWSDDNSNRKERIYFYQVQFLKDITPNDAYRIALEHGFVGTVEDWLESMRGYPGKDNYEIAVECGYKGTREEWIEETRGERGYSAYEIAIRNGFEGTEEEWLESLKGKDGKSAYDLAVDHGFKGTEEEWLATIQGIEGKSAYEVAKEHGFEGTEEEWLESLKGKDGKSAYDLAVDHGFKGTEEEWFAKNGDVVLLQKKVDKIESSITWKNYMGIE